MMIIIQVLMAKWTECATRNPLAAGSNPAPEKFQKFLVYNSYKLKAR